MLDSGNDGPAAPDGDAPKMPDNVDPATPYDAPVIADDTPVIPDVGALEIPGDTTPRIRGVAGIWMFSWGF